MIFLLLNYWDMSTCQSLASYQELKLPPNISIVPIPQYNYYITLPSHLLMNGDENKI